ncbi:MAG: hypothetical protein HOP10_12460 [Chitinophagaceae bacterium]|nr:hypothetical protein [Chitinophagaceae bacterium]
MKNRYWISLFVFFLSACNNKEDREAKGKRSADNLVNNNRMYFDSASGFWIDPAEINSNEYRQFPVKDSVPANKD